MKWEAPVMTEQINPDRTIWHIPVELEEEHVGLNDADVGLNSENVGINDADGGLNSENGGINEADVGLNSENVGLNEADVGLNSENVGLNFLLELIERYPGERANFFWGNYKIPVTMRTVERWLKKLRDEKKIEFRGSKKNGGYWLIESI
jgi:hypothetical protein